MKSLISPDYCPLWQVPTLMVRILIWLVPFLDFHSPSSYWLNSSWETALLRSKSLKSLWLIFLDPAGDFDQTLLKISQIPNYLVRERERWKNLYSSWCNNLHHLRVKSISDKTRQKCNNYWWESFSLWLVVSVSRDLVAIPGWLT